jgi:ATP-dependent helicase HrpA
MAPPSIAARLRAELDAAMSVDQARLRARIDRLQRRAVASAEIEAVSRAVAASCARAAARAAAVPQVSYPPELPISERRDDIAQAMREHPVVIVCGATGSGKTTQLPKICLELERGVRGLIGHTQPRRIAARSVAARLAQELAVPLGGAVGFKVRFTDRTGPDAYIKVMTDGILLAETQRDRLLAAYDTIILDEAHERSLNIDFLLGYLKQLLPRRPDLKLLITSATLDAERFARHFGSAGRPAPVIQVSGRAYAVELRYRPLAGDEGDDAEPLEEGIVAAAEDLWRAGPGDILVFLPGEREIRETADLLRASLARRPYASNVEVLPLYARLSIAEQQRVFAPSGGRRIVLATNVAETSLTVPGIHYVIDSGMARVRRYSLRNKVTLLQIEKIAQAAAEQRAGRCGRVAAGVCVRLYSEEDFKARPRFTDPEILRSSLAAVILRMAALDLGEVAAFPFLEAPGSRAIADGYQLLHELSAVDARRELSPLGRELAQLPVDPRIGRMILAARDNGCLAEVLVIASALSVPDPRERPLEKQQAADQAHLRFRDERSDFLGLLALWQFLADALAEGLSHRRLVERCRANFVSYLRLVEWRDLHRALCEQVRELGWRWSDALPDTIDAARYALIHRALLAGLLSNVGRKSDAEEHYLGARGIKFFLHPGSGLAKKGPPWVLAAELTETTRLYARCAAKIEPEWAEAVAGELVEKTHFDPHWDVGRGEVVASERVTLFGLPLVPRRRVSYGTIAPAAAREVFLREALVAGEFDSPAPFLAHNRGLIAAVAELEHKSRRQDVLVDDEAIYAFYAERVGEGISTRVAFDRWRREAEAADPRRLFLTRELLMRHAAAAVTAEQFPEAVDVGGAKLPLNYRFDPGDPLDGLTLTVPLALLNRLDAARLSWLVPGMVREKVAWYLKALPKAWRSRLPPVPEVVTAFVEQAHEPGALRAALRAFVAGRFGAALPAEVWAGAVPPPHLRFNLRVVDAAGRELAAGRDLGALRAQLGAAAQLDFAAAGPALERKGIRSWDFGDLPETLAVERDGHRLSGYPALIRDGDAVALKLLDTREAAEAATRAAVIALMKIALKDALRRWEKGGTGFVQAVLVLKPALATEGLLADVLSAVCDRAFLGDDPLPRSERAFAEQVKRARVRLPAVAESAFALLASIATAYHALAQRLAALPGGARRLGADVAAQRDALIAPGFFAATPWKALVHLPRYLQALERRLIKYADNPARDAKQAQAVAALWERYREREVALRERGRRDPGLDAFRWLLEELKVSLFAQELRTPIPVSYKRLEKAWKAISGG